MSILLHCHYNDFAADTFVMHLPNLDFFRLQPVTQLCKAKLKRSNSTEGILKEKRFVILWDKFRIAKIVQERCGSGDRTVCMTNAF